MNNRDQFVSNPTPHLDKQISQSLTKLNKINIIFGVIVSEFIKNKYFNERYVFGLSLYAKIQLAVESCIHLLKLGYYGTSNAMYRQIYEFILWVRISLAVSSDEMNSIRENFIVERKTGEGITKKYDVIKYIAKKIDWNIEEECSSSIRKDEALKLLEYFYSDLCSFTHASNEAQQSFFASDDFYKNSINSIKTLTILLYMALDTLDMFLTDYNHDYADENGSMPINNLFIESKVELILKDIDKLLSKLDSDKGRAIPFQIAVLRGKWIEKEIMLNAKP